MTVAWWLTAYLIPRAMAAGSPAATLASASSGSLGSSVTRTDRMLADGATPIMPAPRWGRGRGPR